MKTIAFFGADQFNWQGNHGSAEASSLEISPREMLTLDEFMVHSTRTGVTKYFFQWDWENDTVIFKTEDMKFTITIFND